MNRDYPPFHMTATNAAVRPFVAALGEHTGELLAEVGYTPAEIAGTSGSPACIFDTENNENCVFAVRGPQ